MPPRKKAKKSQKRAPAEEVAQIMPTSARRNVRGRRGGLKDMPNMPLDVLMDIFSFMHPKDLLNLARTSKTFRAFFMARSAQPLWKASMARVDDLPPCPTYMCEPQYINLLFFNHCHNCLKTNIQTVHFEFSARYCGSCKATMFVDLFEVTHLFNEMHSVAESNNGYLPAACDSKSYRWHKPDVDALEARWKCLVDDSEKKALVEEYVSRLKLVREASQAFATWKDLQKAKRSSEIRDSKEKRLESVTIRLREEGWGEELDWLQDSVLDCIDYRQLFGSKAEPLTDRGWKKTRQEAVAYMEGIRQKRLDAARKLVLRSHFESFAEAVKTYRGPEARRKRESDLSPHMVDLAVMDEFKAILDVPEGADLSALGKPDEMCHKLDAAHLHWREERKQELSAMVKQELDVPDGVDPLTLACALFRCRVCDREDLRYPAVVAHICARGPRYDQDLYGTTASAFWSRKGSRSPWSSSKLSFSTSAASLLRPILQACGLDPNTATIHDVDRCPARLTCQKCSAGGAHISTWSVGKNGESKDKESYRTCDAYSCWTALVHALEMNCRIGFGGGRGEPHWKRVTEAEEKAIIAAEKDVPVLFMIDFNWDELLHGCGYCEFIARREKMSRHLVRRHDIDADDDNVDLHCYNHYDGEPTLPSMSLRRYDDGRVKAEYGLLANKFTAFLFAVIGEPLAFDYDNDGIWDSDDDDSSML